MAWLNKITIVMVFLGRRNLKACIYKLLSELFRVSVLSQPIMPAQEQK